MLSATIRVREPCGCMVDHGNLNGVIPVTFCRRSDHGKENCGRWRTGQSEYQCAKHFWITFVNNLLWDGVLAAGAFSAVYIGIEIAKIVPKILTYISNTPTYYFYP